MKGVAMELSVLLKLSKLIFCPVIAVTKNCSHHITKPKNKGLESLRRVVGYPTVSVTWKIGVFFPPTNSLVSAKNVVWHHLWQIGFYAGQFSLLTPSCLTLCDPMDWSTPGFPVHHQLLEPTQTHIHHIGDAIQLSHPLVWVNLSGGRSGLHWIFLVCCLRFSYLSSLLWQTVWCSFQPVLLRCNLIVLC